MTTRRFVGVCPSCEGDGRSYADRRWLRRRDDPEFAGCHKCEGSGEGRIPCAAPGCPGGLSEDGVCGRCGACHCSACWAEADLLVVAATGSRLCGECIAESEADLLVVAATGSRLCGECIAESEAA